METLIIIFLRFFPFLGGGRTQFNHGVVWFHRKLIKGSAKVLSNEATSSIRPIQYQIKLFFPNIIGFNLDADVLGMSFIYQQY